MKSIMIVCPNATDATSFYRGVGPLSYLKRSMPEINLTFVNEVNWASLSMVDLVFMQRPYDDYHVKIAEMCKVNRKPLWIDYDDDLFAVPFSNPAFHVYMNAKTSNNIEKVCKNADVISVSTSELIKSYKPYNKNIQVIPNALDLESLPKRTEPMWPRHTLINWRGTNTHDEDLYYVTREIQQLAEANPRWTWNWIGSPFWLTFQALHDNNRTLCKAVDPKEYWKLILDLQPAIQIVPLYDQPFNRAKSNIAFLEAAYTGAITVAPDWPEWQKPGIVNYTGSEDFKRKMQNIITSIEEDSPAIQKQAQEAWDWVLENATLEKVNELRKNIVTNLVQ